MKALIQKDIYVLWKQMRMFLLALVIMAVAGGAFNSIFIVVWCSMLPYSAMAYDERSHWEEMAAMMPYTRRDIVLSKYVLGWLCMGAAAALSIAVQVAASAVMQVGVDYGLMMLSFCMGVFALDVTMPVIFRLGVERGRLAFMLVVFGVAFAGSAMFSVGSEVELSPVPAYALLPAAVIATLVSIPLSMKLYGQRS